MTYKSLVRQVKGRGSGHTTVFLHFDVKLSALNAQKQSILINSTEWKLTNSAIMNGCCTVWMILKIKLNAKRYENTGT